MKLFRRYTTPPPPTKFQHHSKNPFKLSDRLTDGYEGGSKEVSAPVLEKVADCGHVGSLILGHPVYVSTSYTYEEDFTAPLIDEKNTLIVLNIP